MTADKTLVDVGKSIGNMTEYSVCLWVKPGVKLGDQAIVSFTSSVPPLSRAVLQWRGLGVNSTDDSEVRIWVLLMSCMLALLMNVVTIVFVM